MHQLCYSDVMTYDLLITAEAQRAIDTNRDARLAKRIIKALALLSENPHHPSLQSHRYSDLDKTFGQSIWESYVHTGPSGWRMWWFFGPENGQITVVVIGPHP